MEDKETTCMTNCTEKFLKTTQRIGMRLNEFEATRAMNPWEPDEKKIFAKY